MDAVLDNRELVLEGFGYTIALFLVSGVLSMALGTLLVAFRVGPVAVLRLAGGTYVTLVRNTPLVIVFAFFQFAAPDLGIKFNWVDVHLGPLDFTSFFGAAVVSLALYTSAFVCEALRSGVNAVPLGQAEAARAIGLTFAGSMRQVILPQAIRASLPPVASVQIALVKNTSVAAIFGVAEAVRQMRGLTLDYSADKMTIFAVFALGYILIVAVVSFAATMLERRWRVA